jgi:uncharacterized tellurite resistance protein B-like protein
MIGFLKRLMDADPQDVTSEHDAHLAMAALLVKVARADWDYSDDEKIRIDEILIRRYAMSAPDAAALRAEAEEAEREAADVVQFTRAVKKAVNLEDRDSVIEALWELVLSDGDRAHEEDTALRKIAPLLGINDVDSARARQRVQARG